METRLKRNETKKIGARIITTKKSNTRHIDTFYMYYHRENVPFLRKKKLRASDKKISSKQRKRLQEERKTRFFHESYRAE